MKGIFSPISGAIVSGILAVCSLLFIARVPGSLFLYLAFDFSWLSIFYVALVLPRFYVCFFTYMMLFLGIWAKYMVYVGLKVPFLEPVGDYWQRLPVDQMWNRIYLVLIMAALGILIAHGCCKYLSPRRNREQLESVNNIYIPTWYVQHRVLSWSCIIFLSLVTNVINMLGRINVTGLTPLWVLPLHLNFLITWLMMFVTVLVMAAFIGWDRLLNIPGRKFMFYWVMFLAFVTSVTVLSRAIYLFWTLPYLFVLIQPKTKLKDYFVLLVQNKKFIVVYMMLAVMSIYGVNMLRTFFYDTHLGWTAESSGSVGAMFVKRWVGLEGVVATVSFPSAGPNFFKKALFEVPYTGDPGIYNREVVKFYKNDNHSQVFATLPGVIGVLNYSASLWIMAMGMFFLIILLSLAEKITCLRLRLVEYVLMQGFLIAYWCISEMNIPYLGLVNFAEYFVVTLILILVSRNGVVVKDNELIAWE